MAGNNIPSPEVLRQLLRYEPETGKLFWREREGGPRKWNTRYANKEAFTAIRNTGYLHGRVFDKGYQAHRVAWAIHYGRWPKGEIDHINGDRIDNRIDNLRDIPKADNQRNMKRLRTNRSGRVGVFELPTGKWKAYIASRHIGNFDTKAEACAARAAAEKRLGFHANHGRAVN